MVDVLKLLQVDPQKKLFRVNRRSFLDQQVLELEREKIFRKCWLYVGHESEVANPGDYHTRNVGGSSLIFNRDMTGKVNAFINACPHRGALVRREQSGNSKTHQCFYHAWTFNSEGKLVGLPESADGYDNEFNQDCSLNLTPVRIESYRGFYFINYDEHAISLEAYLGDSKEYIDLVVDQSAAGMEIVGGTHLYSMRGNWKLLCENSADGYHGIPTHKTYFEYLRESNGKDFKPENPEAPLNFARDLGNGSFVTEKNGYAWGRPVARWIPAFGEIGKEVIEQKKKELIERFGVERGTRIAEHDFNMVIFPNLVINNIVAVVLRTFYPKEPGYMDVTQWCIGPKDEPPEFRNIRLKNFLEFLGPGGFATPDDNEALELCHQGYLSNPDGWNDISKGMHKELKGETLRSYDEYHMRVFWKQWHKRLNEGK